MSELLAQEAEFSGTSRFELIRELGRGGMGVVYQALDREQNQHVALKTVQHMSASALLRFKNEFRAMADVRHPNLVRLGELQEAGGVWFFTMELIDGVDLLRHVRPSRLVAGGTLSPPPAADAPTFETVELPGLADPVEGGAAYGFDEARLRADLRQLAAGVAALHAAGLVHRDIKPGNLLVTADGRLVILDFGLVMGADASPLEGRGVGTAAFMAPEQARAQVVGPPADWYSVGATLYLALTGRPPYVGRLEEIQAQQERGAPAAPSTLVDGVPADLETLCLGLLRLAPGDRFGEREVLDGLGAPRVARATGTRFVGRAAELAELAQGFARAGAGQAVTLVVSGESGVGKSALVKAWLRQLGDAALLLAGRCYERESVPYKAVDQVMDALSRLLAGLPDAEALLPAHVAQLASVFPVLGNVKPIAAAMVAGEARIADSFQLRAQAFEALRELLARLAARAPVVVAIDDLQWADADSLALLADVLRPPGAPPVFLVATARAAAMARLRAQLPPFDELRVGGLPGDEALELARQIIARGEPATGLVGELIAREAEGHPLFIDALVRHRRSHPGDERPLRLDDALVARLGDLGAPAARVLELVCLAGGPLAQEACARAAGQSFGDFVAQADRLRGAGLLRSSGVHRQDLVEPYHDRVREAVVGTLGEDARRDTHVRLARAIEALPDADPEILAVHFRAGGDPRKAARFAARAADRAAAALAFDRAARLYRDALEEPANPGVAQSLRLRLAEALSNAGHGSEAAETYLLAAEHAPAHTFDLHRRAAEQFLRSGRSSDAVRTLEAVLAKAGRRLPRSRGGAIASFLWGRMRLRLRGLRFQRRSEAEVPAEILQNIELCHGMVPLGMTDAVLGQPYNAWHLRLALDSGVPAKIVRALAPEITIVASVGIKEARRIDRYARLGLQLADEAGDAYARGFLLGGLGIASYCLSRWRDCLAQSTACYEIMTEHVTGAAWEQDAAALYAMRARFFLGQLAELRRQLPLALKSAIERGDVYMQANLGFGLSSAYAWLADDDGDAVRRHVDEATRVWSYPGVNFQTIHQLWSLLSLELYEGRLEAAEARLARSWAALAASGYMRMQVLRMTSVDLQARIELAAAARDRRRERLARVTRTAASLRREGLAWGDASAARLEAGAACIAGDDTRAVGLLLEAERGFTAADMALHVQIVRRQRGRLLAGDEGRALVDGSDTWMRGQGIVAPERYASFLAPGFG